MGPAADPVLFHAAIRPVVGSLFSLVFGPANQQD
jgi:hypothetical protein